MNGKKAKLLRRMAGFHPSEPKEYDHVVVAKRRILQFEADGTSNEIIKDRTMAIRKGTKQVYKRYKQAYYMLKTKGGHRNVKRKERI